MIKEIANRWIYPICPKPVWLGLCLARRQIVDFTTNQSSLRTTGRFLFTSFANVNFIERIKLVWRFNEISRTVDCPHSQHEMFEVATAVLSFPQDQAGCIVEAGCYKGGSAAKLSLVAALSGRELVLFDSFEGLPENDEEHFTTASAKGGAGLKVDNFSAGDYRGSLEEVKHNIGKFGNLSCCRFEKGWFSDTMPNFDDDVCVAYIDVDLVLSTKDCIANLRGNLLPNGTLYSQDGHLVRIQDLLADNEYWTNEVGCRPPRIKGLGKKRMVRIEFAY